MSPLGMSWARSDLIYILMVGGSVWDSDGEFLLIEAAEELPSWVSPSNAENRVRPYMFTHLGIYSKYALGLDP